MRNSTRTGSSMPAKSINSRVKSIQNAELRRMSALSVKQSQSFERRRNIVIGVIFGGLAIGITAFALIFGVATV